MNNDPLTQEHFAALIAPYVAAGECVAVAVSGGPDSMALAFCLLRYLKQSSPIQPKSSQRRLGSHFLLNENKTNGMPAFAGMTEKNALNLTALIVEHGLRAESADEASAVAANLRGMGIETEILPWVHDEVKSRVHVRARMARYGLLIAACKKRGIGTLLLAHHADDQAETILMRFAKGSGIDGLAGMDAITEVDGVRLVRPLLDVPKARLLAICAAYDIPFVTDPSNVSQKYARGRLRRVLPLLTPEGLSPERLVDLGHRAHEAKEALDFYTQGFLREHTQILAGGAVRVDITALRGVPRAVALRAVSVVLTDLHAGDYPPERKHVLPFLDWLLDTDHRDARTLHGCLVQKGDVCDKAGFLREGAALTDRQPIESGQTVLWDGRWRVTAGAVPLGCEVRALGTQTHELTDRLAPRLRALIPQGRVRACLPALWCGDALYGAPSFSKEDQGVASALRVPFSWE